MTFIYILIAGLVGVAGHWVTRWSQGRTSSTFWEYLMCYKANTLSSFFSILASSSAIYTAIPVDIGGRDLMMLLLGCYSSGYMLDSKVNKDKSPNPVNNEPLKEVEDDKAKSLNNLLDDDRSL